MNHLRQASMFDVDDPEDSCIRSTAVERSSARAASAWTLADALLAARTEADVLRAVVEQGMLALRAASGGAWVKADAGEALVPGYLSASEPAGGHRAPSGAASGGMRLERALVTPAGGVHLGALCFERAHAPFDADDRALLGSLAGLCARAIEQARRFREVQQLGRVREEFLGTMAHELRTPMNAVLGWATLLRGRTNDPASLERGLEIIERNARAQARLVEEVLDVSRMLTGRIEVQRQRVELAAVLREALDEAAAQARAKGVTLEARMGDETASSVSGDPRRLRQVLAVLCSNAVQFTPKGGVVTATIERGDGVLRVRVCDTGRGLTTQHLGRIFDGLRRSEGGTPHTGSGGLGGLGLTIARHLIEQQGGTLVAESVGEGHGACFTVVMPEFSAERAAGPVSVRSWHAQRVDARLQEGALDGGARAPRSTRG